MRLFLLGCLLAGCGRFGFDTARTRQVDARPDTALDASPPVSLCPIGTVADPIIVAGQTFAYTAVNNQTAPVASTVVNALVGGTQVATTTSDSQSNYALAIPTGGTAVQVEIDYSPPGYWTTQVIPARTLGASITGPNMNRWQLGDGPVWADGQMGSVYSGAGTAYDLAKGTLEIAARDCSENPVEGVVITVEPPPEKLMYIDTNGNPSATLTATVLPYTHAVGFNAVPGPTHITATRDGVKIYSLDIDVPAGRFNTYPVFYIP